MTKKPFITKEQAEEIIRTFPTPFHIYDEKAIRENARNLYKAFAWNKGFREYFAVKATPTPAIRCPGSFSFFFGLTTATADAGTSGIS